MDAHIPDAEATKKKFVTPLRIFQETTNGLVGSKTSKKKAMDELNKHFNKLKSSVDDQIEMFRTEALSNADAPNFIDYATKMDTLIDGVRAVFGKLFPKLEHFIKKVGEWLEHSIERVVEKVGSFLGHTVLSMAQNMDYAQQSRTTTMPAAKEKTLVLRSKAETLKKYICDNLPKNKLLEDAKRSNKKDAREAISATLDKFRSDVKSKLDSLQAEILSHAPDEPTRQEGQTEEEFQKLKVQYEQDVAAFEAYADEATKVVDAVIEIFTKTITRLQDFSQYLWKMIEDKTPDIDKKCKEFISKLAKEIEGGFSNDPNSSASKMKTSCVPFLSGGK